MLPLLVTLVPTWPLARASELGAGGVWPGLVSSAGGRLAMGTPWLRLVLGNLLLIGTSTAPRLGVMPEALILMSLPLCVCVVWCCRYGAGYGELVRACLRRGLLLINVMKAIHIGRL